MDVVELKEQTKLSKTPIVQDFTKHSNYFINFLEIFDSTKKKISLTFCFKYWFVNIFRYL